MHQNLIAIIQQILGTVGNATVLVIAAAASRHLSRLVKVMTKTPRACRFMIDLGRAHIDVAITIGGTPQGRKSLTAVEGDDRDRRGDEDR